MRFTWRRRARCDSPSLMQCVMCEIVPHSDYPAPQTDPLQHSDASGEYDYNVQNRLNASRHRNVCVNQPQPHPYDDQRQDDIHNGSSVTWNGYVAVDERPDNSDGKQCQGNIEQWHFTPREDIEQARYQRPSKYVAEVCLNCV